MSIKINTTIHRAVPVINDNGLILAVLMNARQTEGTGAQVAAVETPEVLRINSLEELTSNFAQNFTENKEVNNGLEALKELYVLEYLIRGGANLLVLSTNAVGEFDDTDAVKLRTEDVEYKIALAPYYFISATADATPLYLILEKSDNKFGSVPADLILDVVPTLGVGEINSITVDKSKVGLAINSGIVPFTSVYDWKDLPSQTDFHIVTDGEYAEATDFVGIPASAAIALRESRNLNNNTPWLPIAGERTGVFTEFTKVFRKFTTPEKNAFQAGHINPMVNKRGVGVLMVAQNTTLNPTFESNPLRRRHVVSLVLAIQRRVKAISEYFLFSANNPTTWADYKLMLDAYLGGIKRAGGLDQFNTVVDGTIISSDDINNGIMRAYIEITPVGVVESMEINIAIREHTDSVDVEIVGLEGGI